MALKNYLAKIKSSGIYRFVFDKSEIPGIQTETLRLVVGYSDKGPYNTLVYVESPTQFESIFGGISKKLERKGCFFHRNALQCLATTPIFCLNLKNLKDETVEGVSFDNTGAGIPSTQDLHIVDLFNTDRFWTLEPEKLDTIFPTVTGVSTQKYISISATDDKSTSKTFYFRGYTPNGYDVTFKDYFAQTLNGAELPSYLEGHENDIMEDYFAEIYVFNGKFDTAFKQSQAMITYFDENGKTKPYVLDSFGNHVDTLDALANDPNSGFVNKYQGIMLPDFESPTSTALSLDDVFNADYTTHKLMMHLNANELYDTNNYIQKTTTTGWLSCYNNGNLNLSNLTIFSANGAKATANFYRFNDNNDKLEKYVSGTDDSEVWEAVDAVNNDETFTVFPNTASGLNGYNPYSNATSVTTSIATSGTTNYITETQLITTTATFNPTDIIPMLTNVYGLQTGDKVLTGSSANASVVILSEIEIKQTASSTGTVTFTIKYKFNDTIAAVSNTEGPNVSGIIKCNHKVGETLVPYNDTYLEGFDYTSPFVNPIYPTIDEKVNAVLNTLKDYSGLRVALTNNVDSEYHYLVDTFTSYGKLAGTKNILAQVAKEKDNCLALLNWPSVKNLKANNQTISSVTSNDAFKCDREYTSWVAYYTPAILRNPVTGTKYEVPSAAMVSNLYMAKYESRYPYSIVAGPNYGVLYDENLIGPDFNYARADLDLYEPYGINCLVYKPYVGTYINSQQTAKQKPVTTLSKINVRELVIYLQDEIERILTASQWEFNTQSLRDLVKSKVDILCEQVRVNGGLYQFYNVCDESNNTDDVINNEMFVISTSIEPGMGAGKMVQELTIYRKGGMSSIIQ